MGDEALATLNELALPLARTVEDRPGEVQTLTPVDRRARRAGHRRLRSTKRTPSARSGRPSGRSAPGGRTSPRTEVASPRRERGTRCCPSRMWWCASGASSPSTGPRSRSTAGEICGLIGPNGAGKTTLFNCISRLARPRRGLDRASTATDLLARAPHEIAALGIARTFQHLGLVPLADRARERDARRAPPRPRLGFLAAALAAAAGRAATSASCATPADALLARARARRASPTAPPSASPYGTLKRVELARALCDAPAAAAARRAGRRPQPRRGRRARRPAARAARRVRADDPARRAPHGAW